MQVKESWIFGYKEHLRMDAESEIIAGSKTTPGNEMDGHYFQDVIPEDAAPHVVTADKA